MRTITRLGALAAGTLATAVLLSGCGALIAEGVAGTAGASSSAAPSDAVDTRTVYGFVLITDLGMTPEIAAERDQRLWDTGDSSCVAPAGFEDIAAGGPVQILGGSGVLATGVLEVGDWQSDVMSANGVVGCGFPFVVEGVPSGPETYGLHVGADSRPAAAFTASELRAGPRLFLP